MTYLVTGPQLAHDWRGFRVCARAFLLKRWGFVGALCFVSSKPCALLPSLIPNLFSVHAAPQGCGVWSACST